MEVRAMTQNEKIRRLLEIISLAREVQRRAEAAVADELLSKPAPQQKRTIKKKSKK